MPLYGGKFVNFNNFVYGKKLRVYCNASVMNSLFTNIDQFITFSDELDLCCYNIYHVWRCVNDSNTEKC